MRVLIALAVLLFIANGVFVLALNLKKWREPVDETPALRAARHALTAVFVVILFIAALLGLLAIVVPLGDMILTD